MPDHFDVLAPFYDRLISPPDPARLHDLLQLPTGGWLLDAGGGTGRVSHQLAPLVSKLVISDLSHPMLKQAFNRGNIWPVQGHAERLPFPTESFDRILVVDAFHHFCDQKDAIYDLLRVLKPGGRLVIEEPDIRRFAVKFIALAEKLMLMRSHFYSAARIQKMLSSHGVSAEVISEEQFAVWVVAEKKGG